jgi:hypothetical protein
MKELEEEMEEGLLLADGFEDAFIGVVHVFTREGREPRALYDLEKCVRILKKRDGMTEEDAWECLEFNTLGAYVGERTPGFAVLRKLRRDRK